MIVPDICLFGIATIRSSEVHVNAMVSDSMEQNQLNLLEGHLLCTFKQINRFDRF